MTLLLFSLIVTAIATLIQAFWKMETLTKRSIFAIIIIVGTLSNFLIAKGDAIKNDKLQEDIKNSQSLLQSANDKIKAQSLTINTGFSNLTAQMSREGINNKAILLSVKNLEANVQQLTNDSRNYISEALGLNGKQGFPGKNRDIYIALGNKNAIAIDTKNQFAVESDTPDENNKVTIIMNGGKRKLAPGGQILFTDDQSSRAYLVYKGLDDKKMVFFVKSR